MVYKQGFRFGEFEVHNVFGKIIMDSWFRASSCFEVRLTNYETTNKSRGPLQSLLLYGVGQILNVFWKKIIKINHKLSSIAMFNEIYVTVKVI